ncbi:MAG: LegC family aminotransferase [Candidatus Levybacteria bacterium]|nr:LegC family aminotransferase [Candidatus Levybacteria bacterium]
MNLLEIIEIIRKVYRQQQEHIPLHVPKFAGKEKEYLCDTIDSTYVSSVGPYVDKFEQMMQKITGATKAVAVVNGTCGIQVALRLVGVKPGEEVLTQALTFIATANAVHYNGAHSVFLDVDKDSMGLSPTALHRFLNEFAVKRADGVYNKESDRRIAACMPMHTFGFMCRIEEIVAICKEWGIPVVEDAAEALGSGIGLRSAGTFGDIGVVSLNGNKIVTSGGGGAVLTMDNELGNRAKHLTTTAKVPHSWEYVHDEVGYNFRMPNINAALACAQLEQLNKFLVEKANVYGEYNELFENHSIEFRRPLVGTYCNHWLMCIQLPDKETRDAFLKLSNESGVMTRPIWRLMNKLPMYLHSKADSQINAQFLEDRIVNIPSSVR